MTGRLALVTGATGQDGTYLVERLLADGYAVHGIVRSEDLAPGLPDNLVVHEADLADGARLHAVIDDVEPDEIFNLGGVSSVAQSWQDPELTARVSGLAALTVLQAAETLRARTGREVRVLQASSAEIFGEPEHSPQDEQTPIAPISPYGAAKAFAHHSVLVRRRRGLFAVNCILFNHESPRRPTTFVTRKITAGAARIAREGGTLMLGNLEARRDWGWAPDYVDAMLRAVRHHEPQDYVIATGQARSVAEFVAAAFTHVGITDWQSHVETDPRFMRPVDSAALVGDSRRARDDLGWSPTKDFEGIVSAMVDADLALAEADAR